VSVHQDVFDLLDVEAGVFGDLFGGRRVAETVRERALHAGDVADAVASRTGHHVVFPDFVENRTADRGEGVGLEAAPFVGFQVAAAFMRPRTPVAKRSSRSSVAGSRNVSRPIT
jgi:hypothetical protein